MKILTFGYITYIFAHTFIVEINYFRMMIIMKILKLFSERFIRASLQKFRGLEQ